MRLTKEQILDAVMDLELPDRESIAVDIYRRTFPEQAEAQDQACIAESRRRMAEYTAGRMSASAPDEAIDRVLKRSSQ